MTAVILIIGAFPVVVIPAHLPAYEAIVRSRRAYTIRLTTACCLFAI
ncbi:MAG: hypothetical protein LC793_21680 [Thermomicrobia bacterium]|nr:hypothetical protein [Thermomicrobia bacterium]